MNSTNSRTILLKKMMAVAGLIWFVYLIFHMFSVLSFHSGEAVFSGFYVWLNSSIFYPILLALLVLTISLHIVIAVSRQLSNNESIGERYKKTYPKAIPRLVAWLGASIMLAFIVIHSIQMLSTETVDLYQEIHVIFNHPLMWFIYGLGLLSLSTHLHHALTNVLQTLGISSSQCHGLALFIVVVIMAGFASIPLGILYA
jgi:succinate dehydrogenase / fumarate reductase cytochrome b subunit